MAKGITIKDKNGGTLYPKTVADLVLDSETGEPIGKVITSMGKITTDDNKKWLRVESEGGKRYFVALTELTAPNPPTINTTIYNVVEGSFNITVTNNTTGATMEYKIDDSGSWALIENNTITYDTEYENNKENFKIYLKIYLRATKNGEVSKERIVDITVNPKVANGSVSVSRNNKNSDWSTEAKITLSASQTTGAKSEYSEDGGDSWTVFSGTKSITVSTNANAPQEIDAGTYKVRATKEGGVYEKAEEAQNGGFKIGARKAYYGFSSNVFLNNLSDITSLETTGGAREEYKLKTKTTYQIYPSKSGSTENGYIWLCCQDGLTPGKIFSDADAIIPFGFNDEVIISGYKCYRSENLLPGNVSHTIYIKD